MERLPEEPETSRRELEPERERLPELAILAPLTFLSSELPEEEISKEVEPEAVMEPRILESDKVISALLFETVMRVASGLEESRKSILEKLRVV